MIKYKAGKPCKRMVPVGTFPNEDGGQSTEYGKCGAPTIVMTWREIDGNRCSDTSCSACDAPEPVNLCDFCERPTSSEEGLCYECQCAHHAVGAFDMDGGGWR